MSDIVLELKDITKSFPGVKALDKVNFQLERGEIHALMGENGAGKSTFIKVMMGVHEANDGEMILNGKKVVFKSPKDSQKNSIAAIYQHGTVYQHLSVTENIFIGHEETVGFMKKLNWRSMHGKAKTLLESLSSDIDPQRLMSGLTVAEQQIVEIAKAISTDAKIIIMDEPTAALSNRECENLYTITEKLRDSGVSIIFISHRFEDMYRLAKRVTVLRDGKYIGCWRVDEIPNKDLINAMVGREISEVYPTKTADIGDEVFRAENLSRTGYFKNISFNLRKGEILGFTGLVGAGRTEVMQSIFGVESLDSGKLFLDGKPISIKHPLDAINLGVGLLPEDRQRQGLILEWDIYKNVTLATLEQFTKSTILQQKEERLKAKEQSEKMALKAVSVYDLASSLSGGNQQKVVVAKLLNSDLKVLILDEPTKGVDVGSKSQIYGIMNDLASQGYGIIMVSSEMPEVLGMCDRIVVMHEGNISLTFEKGEATQEKILEASMNIKKAHDSKSKGGYRK